MSKKFGTDGVRGVANKELTPELAFSIGQAAGRYLRESNPGRTSAAVIGRDTRRSGVMLEHALIGGFNSAGADCVSIGIATTPAIAYLASKPEFDLGVVISASHNPAPDNGIKILGPDGGKLSDEAEAAIEIFMDLPFEDRPTGGEVGSWSEAPELLDLYAQKMAAIVPEGLSGLHIALDGAHGAAFEIAPKIFESLGARVTTVCCEPDGMNINKEGGATKPERVQNLTKETGADFGVAFDGDADRAIFADRTGLLINGDRTLAIYAQYGLASGELNPPAIVGTVMSNGGFERFLQDLGIELHRTPVGDKYVSRKLREIGGKAGGEQSGHLIFPEISATGDGIATALMLLKVLRSSNQPLEVLANSYDAWPQLLLNVTVEQRDNWDSRPTVRRALDDAEQELEGRGRIVARASGTQPMIRIMVEAECYDLRDRLADSILDAMEKELGATLYSRVDLTHALGD